MARLSGIALTIIGAGPYRQHLETVFQGTDTFLQVLFGEDLACACAVMSLRKFRSDFGFHHSNLTVVVNGVPDDCQRIAQIAVD